MLWRRLNRESSFQANLSREPRRRCSTTSNSASTMMASGVKASANFSFGLATHSDKCLGLCNPRSRPPMTRSLAQADSSRRSGRIRLTRPLASCSSGPSSSTTPSSASNRLHRSHWLSRVACKCSLTSRRSQLALPILFVSSLCAFTLRC